MPISPLPRKLLVASLLALLSLLSLPLLAPGQQQEQEQQRPAIPEDLLDDEHVREEFGVNQFTTPSIKKLFVDLEQLGDLPYDTLRRDFPDKTPRDRTQLALSLGGLIADGFLVVQAQELAELERVGREVVKYTKILGTGTRVTSHLKSVIEHRALGDWDTLKDELATTQANVEAEMVLLRDVDAAHLIALGGWLRAFEIITITALQEPFAPEKANALKRVDIADYFLMSLETLEPDVVELPHIQRLHQGVTELRDKIDMPASKPFTRDELASMNQLVGELVNLSQADPPPTPAQPAPAAPAAAADAPAQNS
ncbi:MAG: hypothetical protein AAF591_05585 [Verrucomicrobiota bacterium]